MIRKIDRRAKGNPPRRGKNGIISEPWLDSLATSGTGGLGAGPDESHALAEPAGSENMRLEQVNTAIDIEAAAAAATAEVYHTGGLADEDDAMVELNLFGSRVQPQVFKSFAAAAPSFKLIDGSGGPGDVAATSLLLDVYGPSAAAAATSTVLAGAAASTVRLDDPADCI